MLILGVLVGLAIVSVAPDGSGQAYCISALSGGRWAHYSGPGGKVVADPSTVTRNRRS